jgi:hypothetical protein
MNGANGNDEKSRNEFAIKFNPRELTDEGIAAILLNVEHDPAWENAEYLRRMVLGWVMAEKARREKPDAELHEPQLLTLDIYGWPASELAPWVAVVNNFALARDNREIDASAAEFWDRLLEAVHNAVATRAIAAEQAVGELALHLGQLEHAVMQFGRQRAAELGQCVTLRDLAPEDKGTDYFADEPLLQLAEIAATLDRKQLVLKPVGEPPAEQNPED